MKLLRVVYQGWVERWTLGTLADNGRELLFEYSREALAQGLELSPLKLRLQPQAHGGFPAHQHRLPGLVADALPDGWGWVLMDRLFRRHGRDPARLSVLERLAFLGERTTGALTFEPADEAALPAQDLQLLELAQQARQVVDDQDGAALRQLALLGGSPHGARPKVLVHHDTASGRIGTEPFAHSQPWLVKFQARGEHKEVCALEDLYARMARACGLEMPPTRWFDLSPELAAFGVQRFDLEAGQRVPLHTLAGALHADFRIPSSVDYVNFLRATRFFTRDQREVDKAFERAVFNVVFHNRDDHPKNFSFRLGRDRRYRLAPCYDLGFNEGPSGEHQMDVCGEGRLVGRGHLLQLARQGGVDERWARACLDRIAGEALGLPGALQAEPGVRPSTAAHIAAAVEANRLRVLSDGLPETPP